MASMDIAQILGWIATFLFSIMIIPQIIKTVKSKDTRGVSLLLFVIFLIANVIALIYAVMISQPPLIIKYTVAILTTVFYIALFLFYTWNKAGKTMRSQETTASGIVMWLTGLSGSGKTTLAEAVKQKYESEGKRVRIIDGDAVRNADVRPLGFSRENISENNRRIAFLAKTERGKHDLILIPVIAPFAEDRKVSREIIGKDFFEIFVDCSLGVCVDRDVKGLYKEAFSGRREKLIGMEGSSVPYEVPISPDLVIKTEATSLGNSTARIIEFLKARGF